MAISTRQVKNKRDSNGVLTGAAGYSLRREYKVHRPEWGKEKPIQKRAFQQKRKQRSMKQR